MTDGRHPTPDCPDPETVAAFIDDRLEPRERAAVEEHLADCQDCYEVWMDAVGVSTGTASPVGAGARSHSWSWLLGIGGVAAVALLSIWLRPVSDETRTQRALDALVAAVGEQRLAFGRFSVGFDWAAVRPPTRSPELISIPLPVQQAALAIRVLASEVDSVANTRALGIAEVTEGRIDSGIRALETSVAAEPARPDFHADLSAALLERWYRSRRAEDAARALNEARLAVAAEPTHPAALFNLALAAEAVGDQQGAVRAWKTYLTHDSETPWAAEARRRLEELERAVAPPVALSRQVERELMMWAESVVSGQVARPPTLAPREGANDLQDSYLTGLLTAAEASVRTGRPNPRVVASALLAMRRSRDRFDLSDYLGAAADAREAGRQFRAANLPATEADMQVAWSLFFAADRRADALADAKRVASSPQASSMPRVLGRYSYLVGLDAANVGRRTQALEHYRTAITCFEQAGDQEQVATTHALLSEALLSQGDSEGSWEHQAEALGGLPHLSTPRRQLVVLQGAIQRATQEGYDGAALWFSEGLEAVVGQTRDPGAHVTLHLLRAPVLARLGDQEGARSSFSAGRVAAAQVPDPDTQRRYRGELGWREGRAFYEVAPLDAIRGLTDAADAFESQNLPSRLAEVYLYRGRAYRANGDRTLAEADWLAGVNVMRAQVDGITDRRRRAAWADNLWGLFSEIIDSHADRPMTALAWLEASRTALEAAPTAGADIAPVAITESEFGSNVVVVLASLPNRLLKWTLNAGGDPFTAMPVGRDELAALCASYVSSLAVGRRPEPDVESRLSELLLPARLTSDPDDSVIFVTDGPLRLFPFGALRIAKSKQFLIEVAVPRLVSSLIGATRLQTATTGEGRPLLVGVGSSGGDTGLRYLPDAAAEVTAIAQLYDSPEVLIDATATRQAVLAKLQSASLAHFATHAIVDPRRDDAALVFYTDGKPNTLTTEDIVKQRLRLGSLVILSACETAVSAVTASSSSVSLAQAFLTAGAAGVIGTLWEIPDDDARTLMTNVHARLRAGRPSYVALADAQRLMLRSHPNSPRWAAVAHLSN